MKTHNASIYHCISCGRVVHAELEVKPPECCGHTMETAVTETTGERDVAEENAGGHPDTATPVIKGRKKPH